ncbi:MAG: lactate racemase domain-containing protein [Nitrospira sp.]
MSDVSLRTKAWFGDDTLAIDFPPSWKVVEVGPSDKPALTLHAMQEALSRPIGTPRLSAIAKGKTKAVIVVDDLTRPTPAADLLPLLVEEVTRAGIPPRAITIMLAGGTHPPASDEEMTKKVGSALSSEIRIMAHDSGRELVDLGVSPGGLPLQLNRTVMECDLKIGVGCIYPHPIAGFSGGAKIILPAVCGVETTRMMHDYLRGSRERGGSIHTELRRDMVAVARKVGLDFIANVTLNHRRAISGLFVGDVVQAHEEGVRSAQRMYGVSILPDADVVVADMYPFDTSWQFAQDRGMWPIERAKQGASRVVIAACPLGLGTHELFPVASPLWSRIARRLTHFRLADLERPLEKVRTVVKLLQQKQQQMMVLSPGLKPHDLKAMFPHAQWYGDWATVKTVLLARHGEGPVTVAVYRCAPFLIPSGALESQAIEADSRHPQRLPAST